MLAQAMALPENLACLLLSFILRHMRPLNIGSRATEQQLPFDRNTSEASGRTANPLAAAPAAATRLWLNDAAAAAAAAETATAAATAPAKYSQEGHLSWEFICYARGYFLCPRPLLAIVLQRFSATEHELSLFASVLLLFRFSASVCWTTFCRLHRSAHLRLFGKCQEHAAAGSLSQGALCRFAPRVRERHPTKI